MQVVDKKEAMERGFPHYFTGKPCKRGHVAPRFTSSGNCTACHALRAVEYRNSKFRNSGILVSREFNRVHEKYVSCALEILEIPVARPTLANLNERAILRALLEHHLSGGSIAELIFERAWAIPLPPGMRLKLPPSWGLNVEL